MKIIFTILLTIFSQYSLAQKNKLLLCNDTVKIDSINVISDFNCFEDNLFYSGVKYTMNKDSVQCTSMYIYCNKNRLVSILILQFNDSILLNHFHDSVSKIIKLIVNLKRANYSSYHLHTNDIGPIAINKTSKSVVLIGGNLQLHFSNGDATISDNKDILDYYNYFLHLVK